MNKNIGVGFGVMILKGEKVLLGLRNEDEEKADSELGGEGTWTMPGGKLDFGERFDEGAVREVYEETSLKIKNDDLELMSLTNDITNGVHFVTAGFLCRKFKGEVKVMEPDEIVRWKWFDLRKLPANIYSASKKVLENYHKGKIYSLKR